MLTSYTDSPVVKKNKRVKEIFEKIDKMIKYYPDKHTHYVYKDDYNLLFYNIPDSIRHRYKNGISHHGIIIMEHPE